MRKQLVKVGPKAQCTGRLMRELCLGIDIVVFHLFFNTKRRITTTSQNQ